MIIPITLVMALLMGTFGVVLARKKNTSKVLWGSIGFLTPVVLTLLVVRAIETF